MLQNSVRFQRQDTSTSVSVPLVIHRTTCSYARSTPNPADLTGSQRPKARALAFLRIHDCGMSTSFSFDEAPGCPQSFISGRPLGHWPGTIRLNCLHPDLCLNSLLTLSTRVRLLLIIRVQSLIGQSLYKTLFRALFNSPNSLTFASSFG